jgi:dipeptidyl aminopeptidase/acylaminoacyl peptidase
MKTLIACAALAGAMAMIPDLAAAAPAAPAARTAPQSVIPIAAFAKRPFMQKPRISPDGSKIVVQMSHDKKGYLAVVDVKDPKAAPDLFVAMSEFREVGDRTVASYRWVGNDTVVLTMASRENIWGEVIDVTRLAAYDIRTKKMTPLAWDHAMGRASSILHVDHDKGRILIERDSDAYGREMWTQPEVVWVDVATGHYTLVERPNPVADTWLADGKGVVRAAIGYDARTGKQRLMYRSNADEQLHTVGNSADTSFTDANVTPEIFLDEPDMAIAVSNKDEYRKLYKVNLKTMTLGPVVFERPGYDVGGALWSVGEHKLYANHEGNKLVGVTVAEGGDREYWFDPDWRVIQQMMDERFGAGNAHLVSRDRRDERLIFKVGKASQPGGYYLYDTAAGKLSLIGWVYPDLADAELNPMSTVTYTARDGLKIPAVVTMPRHRAGQKNLPVVVLVHGGPFGIRQEEEFGDFPWQQALAEQGYVVIEPNYRGSGGYGKDFVLKGRAPDGYGVRMQDDLNDAVAWFAQQGIVDAKRACVMGWSYGGYAAARGAQRDPDLWRCAIAGAGIYDIPLMTQWDKEHLGTFGAKFQATSNDPAGISPARHADAKWSPILVVAGARDRRIPLEQPHTLVSRLQSAGKRENVDYRYVEQKEGTHNLPYEDVAAQWLEESNKWLARWNPAYVPTDRDRPPAGAQAPGAD